VSRIASARGGAVFRSGEESYVCKWDDHDSPLRQPSKRGIPPWPVVIRHWLMRSSIDSFTTPTDWLPTVLDCVDASHPNHTMLDWDHSDYDWHAEVIKRKLIAAPTTR
jgi:hypothetical protein